LGGSAVALVSTLGIERERTEELAPIDVQLPVDGDHPDAGTGPAASDLDCLGVVADLAWLETFRTTERGG
jgi:hypothetical protein